MTHPSAGQGTGQRASRKVKILLPVDQVRQISYFMQSLNFSLLLSQLGSDLNKSASLSMITMNFLEKIISLLAIIFAAGLIASLIYFPQLRQVHLLIPISLTGLVINVALVFVVLRDIFSRSFKDQNRKYMWIALILLFWPSIICYLYSYGFRPRENQQLPSETHMRKY
jgi:hypothetical protein